MKKNFLWLAIFLLVSAGLIIQFAFLYKDIKLSPHLTAEVTGENIISKDISPIIVPVSLRDSGKKLDFEYSDVFFLYPSTSYNHKLAQL